MLEKLGKPVHYFDKDNWIVVIGHGGRCPRCGIPYVNWLGEVVIGGKTQFTGCDACLARDGYMVKLEIT